MDRPDLGTDLQLLHKPTMASALRLASSGGGDLLAVSGLDNLAQALWLRLGVPRGDLAHLGHPDFGSRLHLLIGRLINPQTIALTKAYVREALRREPRIQEVANVDVIPATGAPGTLLIHLTVVPVGQAEPVDLSLTFALEPGQAEASTDAATGR